MKARITKLISRKGKFDSGLKTCKNCGKDYNEKEYERRLFDKKRLDHKLEVFQNITLSSIVEQTCDNWKWLIYTSDRMPYQYK